MRRTSTRSDKLYLSHREENDRQFFQLMNLLSVSTGFRRPDLRIHRWIFLCKRCFRPALIVVTLTVEVRLSLSDEKIERGETSFCRCSSRTVMLLA